MLQYDGYPWTSTGLFVASGTGKITVWGPDLNMGGFETEERAIDVFDEID